MIWVDWCILLVMVVSVLIGVFRGFTRELLGLMTWVLALWAAWAFGDDLAVRMGDAISVPSVRLAAAYGILFFTGLVAGAVTTGLVVNRVRAGPMAGPDRVVGAGFGLLRGVVMVAGFVLFAGMTAARQDPWWNKSLFIGRFEWLAQGMAHLLPAEWLENVKPGDEPQSKAPA